MTYPEASNQPRFATLEQTRAIREAYGPALLRMKADNPIILGSVFNIQYPEDTMPACMLERYIMPPLDDVVRSAAGMCDIDFDPQKGTSALQPGIDFTLARMFEAPFASAMATVEYKMTPCGQSAMEVRSTIDVNPADEESGGFDFEMMTWTDPERADDLFEKRAADFAAHLENPLVNLALPESELQKQQPSPVLYDEAEFFLHVIRGL